MTSAPNSDWTQGVPTPDEPVIVRDKRRIDPQSGQVRVDAARAETSNPVGDTFTSPTGGPPHDAAPTGEADLLAPLRQQVAERTSDLQRLKAEFDNYRRRVERDRQVMAEQATGRLLSALLPTLDDIGRARDHGDLEGPFKAVAESLESALETAGLERFGSRGDEFDPLVHDALMHTYSSEVTRSTCVDIFRAGYRHAGRVLRPAQVAVAEPATADTAGNAGVGQDADGTATGSAPGAGGGSAEAVE
ncbi:nucleotide exchange factor GrpE [Protofrankia symbiont of Coriaria ruscifolia]|uniref:Protein GrpE n=1 Tax=Candidatus Protofrankia californiensis TaxID=1839754 RepID=A0A1C3NUM2_9ACTN|nr:nucleotide exchange factor GrpE [Protofrankia symbiont of Coriaria ruscifolia]SBW19068.1 protein grpE [Candidatus Protofrankia californiensis]